jgi:hypothetical protein
MYNNIMCKFYKLKWLVVIASKKTLRVVGMKKHNFQHAIFISFRVYLEISPRL